MDMSPELVRKALDAYAGVSDSITRNNSILENMPPSETKNKLMAKIKQIRDSYGGKLDVLAAKIAQASYISAPSSPVIDPGIAAIKLSNSMLYKAALADAMEKGFYYELSLIQPLPQHTMSGLFDFISPIQPAPVVQHPDAENQTRGEKTLRYFYDRASTYPAFTLSFEDFLALLEQKMKGTVKYTGTVSYDTLESDIGFDESKIQAAMEQLADNGQGQVPDNWMTYGSAISKSASNPGFWTSVKYASSATATQIGQAASKIGFHYMLPLILVAGGLFIFVKAGGIGQVMKGMKKT